MKVSVRAKESSIEYFAEISSKEELELIKKSLMTNWYNRNFTSQEEQFLAEELIRKLNGMLDDI